MILTKDIEMSENPYRQDNPFVSDESFVDKIKRLEAENQQLTQENQRLRSEIMAHTQRMDEIHRTARSVLDKYPQYERPE